ncbi:MAG TPA: SRPBCC domain-containing protein [Solirubrobacterales bacterium]|nr:SRPBCC domain-containing protein [Solirubrobacterales bacterium]
MPKPFDVEVEIRVEPDRLWRAVTDPQEVAQWFGWDAETLADEIQFIFVDHPVIDGERMRMASEEMGQYTEVAQSGANSVIRAVQSGDEPEDGEFDGMKAGWIAFFHQLKRYVEEHDGETRRTIFLRGTGNAASVAAAVGQRLPGDVWFTDDHTRVIATPDFGPGLGALNTVPPLDADESGDTNFTLTTFGLSDSEFAALAEQWLAWWETVAGDAELVTGAA